MLKYARRYVNVYIDGDKLKDAFKNEFLFIDQHPYAGKLNDKGEIITPSGTRVRVQALKDFSEPIINRETGEVMDDNSLEIFEVTIIGATFPLPFKKGDLVALENLIQEFSYFIDNKLILRFDGIRKIEKKNTSD